MKKFICLCGLVLAGHAIYAQTKATPAPNVFMTVEQMPLPNVDMSAYLSSHIHYPADALKADISGRVVVRFIVNEDGSVSDVTVIRKVYPSLDSVAKAVISEMPNWKPGKQNGKAVKVFFSQPINFTLPARDDKK